MAILHVKSPDGSVNDVDLNATLITDSEQNISGVKTFKEIYFSPFGRIWSSSQNDSIKEIGITSMPGHNWTGTGAKLALRQYSENDTANDGTFRIIASNGSSYTYLVGYPSGYLAHGRSGTTEIPISIDSKNTADEGYIRYDNGIQICWGSGANVTVPRDHTYPMPFISQPAVGNNNGNLDFGGTSATQFHVYHLSGATTGVYYSYIAIGRWK